MARLSECREGDTVRVVRVLGAGPLKARLMEMGLLRGVVVRVAKYAPLKDPLELVVKGFHLSLRTKEAEHIGVTLC